MVYGFSRCRPYSPPISLSPIIPNGVSVEHKRLDVDFTHFAAFEKRFNGYVSW